jgi:hypothetical protein
MRKKFVTGFAAIALFSVAALPALAGGVGEPEIEPEVFTSDEAVAAGTLGGREGLIILALIVGGIAVAGDSN